MGEVNEDNVVKIAYHITVPINAPPGAHYAQIIISQQPTFGTNGESQVGIGAEVGYQILLNLKGQREYNTDLVNFNIKDNQFLFSSLPTQFETTFKNKGNVYVIPNANIEIFQFGDKKDVITMNPNQYRVFPGKSKTYANIWSEENVEDTGDSAKVNELLANRPQNFFQNVSYQLSHFRFGLYTAEIQGFAGAQVPFKSSVTFFVLPYHLIITLILVIIILFVLLKFIRRSDSEKRSSGKGKKKE
jgi:hypothetical protein